jgi:uncharacterized protein
MHWIRKRLRELAFPSYEECGPIELLILQPTEFCNIDCSYCYLKNRSSKSLMSFETLEASYRLALESGLLRGPMTIAWHAGEPLTAGLAFFTNAVELFSSMVRDGVEFRHSIQTNGMLIDEDWASFFRDYDIKIGISVDGPAFIHDQYRKTRAGRGTHENTLRGMEILRNRQLEFHTITVLTRMSLSYPKEIFEFLVNSGSRYLCFNIEEIEAANKTSTLVDNDFGHVRAQYEAFFCNIIAQISASSVPIRVREIDGALAAIAGWRGRPRGMIVGDSQQTHPFKIVSIDYRGGFSTYSPELLGESFGCYPSFELGNVRKDTLRAAYEGERFKQLYRDIQAGIDLCRRDCDYYQETLA